MMNRTLFLVLAGAVVLGGSATAAYTVLRDDTVTVSAVCAPVDESDRDRAGLAAHLAVVTVDKTLKVTAHDGYHESLTRIRVGENLKGRLPATLDVTQTVDRTSTGALVAAADYKQPLLPGHRYVIGIYQHPDPTPDVWLSTPADGDRLDAVRAQWRDAIAHQNPPRSHPNCNDVVVP
ncbi:hypothetical protein AB0A60_19510 [Streptomyces sp. NPDC046275]|uniref:hypothetical protein n=1 Tax=Streptomyces sp. NPDC046275 TaxID=3157201 RepID=UPI0033D5170E